MDSTVLEPDGRLEEDRRLLLVPRPERATVAIAPKPLMALQTMTPTITPTRRRAGARIRLAARHAH